jgi:hypothetical protein
MDVVKNMLGDNKKRRNGGYLYECPHCESNFISIAGERAHCMSCGHNFKI